MSRAAPPPDCAASRTFDLASRVMLFLAMWFVRSRDWLYANRVSIPQKQFVSSRHRGIGYKGHPPRPIASMQPSRHFDKRARFTRVVAGFRWNPASPRLIELRGKAPSGAKALCS
jgi:hypothetical protein